jgi:hypothetical protein
MEERYGDKWDKRVYAFLMIWQDKFIEPIDKNELERLDNFATPRTYTMAAVRLYELANAPITQEMLRVMLVGLLGPVVGEQLFSFLTMSIDINSLLNNLSIFDTLDIDKKFFAIWAMGEAYNGAVRNADNNMKARIERFMEEALIKKRLLHWLELLTFFVISLSNEPTKAGASPRHTYLTSLTQKYPKVIDELYKVTQLSKLIKV